MKINELIGNKDFEKGLEIKDYISVVDKRKFVVDVIAACTDDIDDFITVDKFKMNIYFDMCVLGLYTNIEIASNFNAMIEQYDELCKYGILNKIIEKIKVEYDALKVILDAELEALLIQNSIDAQVVKIANKVNKVINVVIDKLDEVDFNSFLPEGMDFGELVKIAGMLQ